MEQKDKLNEFEHRMRHTWGGTHGIVFKLRSVLKKEIGNNGKRSTEKRKR